MLTFLKMIFFCELKKKKKIARYYVQWFMILVQMNYEIRNFFFKLRLFKQVNVMPILV